MYMRPSADPARLMIRTNQGEETLELLKDAKISFMGLNLQSQPVETDE